MLRILPFLLVVFLLALSRAAVLPTDEVSPAADSKSMEEVSIPESIDKDVMPEEESAEDSDMDAQAWMISHPYSSWMYNPWLPHAWFSGRRIYYPFSHRQYWRTFDEDDDSEEAPKLSKRDSGYELDSVNRDSGVESAIVEAQDDEVKLQGLVYTYPKYFYRFYRPVYNRYCHYYPTLFRKNPAYFRVHYPVLYRVYASGGLRVARPASHFILSDDEDVETDEDEDPETEDISDDVEGEDRLMKRDEGFEADSHLSFICVQALAGQRPVATRILSRCRDLMGLSRFGYDRDMYWDYPDLGSSIRREVYRRLNRSFRNTWSHME